MIDKKFLSTLTILYVENDEETKNVYKHIFEKLFKKVLISNDNLNAIKKLNNEKIDIILSEVLFANFDGIKLLNQVKKIDKDMPFIFLTSSTDIEHLIYAIKNSVSDYLIKPADSLLILNKIQILCKNKQKKDENLDNVNGLENYLNAINKVAIVSIFDNTGKIHYVNDFLIEISKYEVEDLLEQDYKMTYHPDISKVVLNMQWDKLQSLNKWKGKLKHIAKDDSVFYTNTTIIPIINKNEKELKKFVSIDFLTTKEENEERDYKKNVLYSLKETKRVYQVAQEKITLLKAAISKYPDNSKYIKEFEESKNKNEKYYEELRQLKIKNKKLDLELNKSEEILKTESLIKKLSKEIVSRSLDLDD